MRQKAGALRVGCYVFGAAQIGIAGLEDRLARAEPIDRVARVASFFISRIDGQIDALLDAKSVEAPASRRSVRGPKAAKVAPYQSRYREWWLVLPDFIGPNLDADERRTIGDHVNLSTFSRVVLIHPRDPTKALVLDQSQRVSLFVRLIG